MSPRELDETWRSLEDFADAAKALRFYAGTPDAAGFLCELALRAVGGDHASITSVRSGRFVTIGATSDLPERADKLQYATGEGPCLDAVREQGTIRVDDLETDPRWPEFGRRAAAELGIRSMLAHVLPVDDSLLGAVNLYAVDAAAFSPEQETLVTFVGAVAAAAVGSVEHQERANQLERALYTSRRIGAALGIVMATQGVDLDQAWKLLSKASQNRNIKLAALADTVVKTGSL
jgi:GAF domain-containing protein